MTPEDILFYKNNGYIKLSNVFSPEEIETCSKTYDELFEDKRKSCNLQATWDGSWKYTHGKPASELSVLSIHNLQCHSAIFTRMLLNPTLLEIVSQIVGSPNILLHHTKAHVKPPMIGAPFPTHQDYHYFPYKNDSMVAVFIHLDDTTANNGGLSVFPGSHKLGPLPNKSDKPTHFYVDQTEFSLEKATPINAQKGDVVIFSYLLVHGSYHNVSNVDRRMLLFQMVSAEDTPLQDVHKSPCHGMVLRGRNLKRNADIEKRHE